MNRAHWDDLVAHAREEAPSECCGWARGKDGVVDRVFRAVGSRAWAYGFELGFKDLMAITDAEDEGYQIWVYHSHPRSPAEPSQTDINLAPGTAWKHLIVSLQDEPVVRAWTIGDGRVEEEDILVDG
jgi:proteasome lid subunit RPN8/RPN11